jgi:hypothetical protein
MELLGAKPRKGVGKLFSDPGRFKNLHDYVYVTDKARAWLKMVRDVGKQGDAESQVHPVVPGDHEGL